MKNLTLILFAGLMLAGSTSATAQEQPTPARQELMPGDQIRITVWRKPEFSGDFLIGSNGTVTHPLYREVPVIGVPLATVEERLRAFLTRYETNPQFVIEPLVRIIVAGEIRNANIYSVPPQTTIAQAVAIAGGPTERGDVRRLRIIRDRQEIKLDLSKPDSDAALLQIRSGDQIVMGRRQRPVLEYIGPVASTIAAVAGVTAIILR